MRPTISRRKPVVKDVNPYSLSAGVAGYRIVRLSVELFIVSHTVDGGFSISQAGLFFLIYRMSSVIWSMFYFWFPTIFLGSFKKAMALIFFSVGFQLIGYITFFASSNNMVLMSFAMFICGFGTASWYVNHQTIINFAYLSDNDLKKVANVRQLFESAGFLIPSISLAVVKATLPESLADDVFPITAFVLSIFALGFYATSMIDVVKVASKLKIHEDEIGSGGVWKSIALFSDSSATRYFFINAILQSFSSILGGTMSVITTDYFRQEETSLWIGSIGFPIGAILSAIFTLLLGGKDETLTLYGSSLWLLLILTLYLVFAGEAISYFEDHARVAKVAFFVFGTSVGYFYTKVWAIVLGCWLKELRLYSPTFASRANSISNVGSQAILATAFKCQTSLLSYIKSSTKDQVTEDVWVATATFGVLCLFVFTWTLLYMRRPPLIDLSHFGWRKSFPIAGIVIRVIAKMAKSTIDSMLFGGFTQFRGGALVVSLKDDALKDGGADLPCRTLCYSDFAEFLSTFQESNKQKTKDSYYCLPEVCVKTALLKNQDSFQARMDLIQKATTSIDVLVWSFDGTMSTKFARKLIKKHRMDDVDIRVMIDGVNFYYICLLLNTSEGADNHFSGLKMLADAGIPIKYLLEEEDKDSEMYKCGSHRKILLVDSKYMLSGGRNMEDSYLGEDGIYMDADAVLEGDFESSVTQMLNDMWSQGKDVNDILFGCKFLDARAAFTNPARTSFSLLDSLDSCRVLHIEDVFNTSADDSSPNSDDSLDSSRIMHVEDVLNTSSNDSSPNSDENSVESEEIESNPYAGNKAAMILLNHITGNKNGVDIIYSTLLKLVECAKFEINLVYGYFQLFPHLEKAIEAAIKRGVVVNVYTNSSGTNVLFFYDELYCKGQGRLLELGAKVYVLDASANTTDNGIRSSHHKFATVDNRAVLYGSWNCAGCSIFSDSETSVLLFEDSKNGTDCDEESCMQSVRPSLLCHAFQRNVESAAKNGLYRKVEEAPTGIPIPWFTRVAMTKAGKVASERGF